MAILDKGMAVRVVEELPPGSQYLGQVTAIGKPDWRSGFLVSGKNTSGLGQGLDMRAYPGAGFVYARASGCSASAAILASYDSAQWQKVTGFALAADATATAQLDGYYPFMAASVEAAYDNAWGASAITAAVFINITKGVA
jgi:hypothetical protein